MTYVTFENNIGYDWYQLKSLENKKNWDMSESMSETKVWLILILMITKQG